MRAQAVLDRIFFDGEELRALGFAKQLEDIRGSPPDYLLSLLNMLLEVHSGLLMWGAGSGWPYPLNEPQLVLG